MQAINERLTAVGPQLRRLAAWVCVALLSACGAPSSAPPMATVLAVDLARYGGSWFEVAMLPNRFQAQCVADTQAHYRSVDGDIEVRNRCRQSDGSVSEAVGIAKVVAGSGNAKLRVSFFRPFYGDYWVLALPDDYRWVLVGEPSRKFAWVLSRSPQMSPQDLAQALDRAQALGYDKSAFRQTPQTRALP